MNLGIKRYREKYPERYYANGLISNMIKNGRIKKQPCAICGRLKDIHAHHDNYGEPQKITWYCRYHHIEWHKNNNTFNYNPIELKQSMFKEVIGYINDTY